MYSNVLKFAVKPNWPSVDRLKTYLASSLAKPSKVFFALLSLCACSANPGLFSLWNSNNVGITKLYNLFWLSINAGNAVLKLSGRLSNSFGVT